MMCSIRFTTIAALIAVPFVMNASAQPVADPSAHIQNAVVEGIQISSEPGDSPDEKVVTCYFIFRDKPSSYFYEVNRKEMKLIFEFNDTELGSSPIQSQAEPPITGFSLEKKRVNVNEQIKGLNPEWHDVVMVTFDIEAVPDIQVTDQYNIISFSYKWSTNPEKIAEYAQVEKKSPVLPITLGAAGGGAVAAAVYYFAVVRGGKDDKPEDEPLSTSDLPSHTFP